MNDPAESYDADVFGLPVRQTGRAPIRETVETLADRFLEELRQGAGPSIDDYAERHPALADEIRRLFPAIAALEGWKSAREPALLREAVPETTVIERLGKYRCLRRIGEGGMGIVLEGEELASGRRVAIKVLRWRVAKDSAWRTRFEQEARTASRLHHRGIVPVFESGESGGIYYYVMPLVDGVSLDVIIERFREGRDVVYADEIRRRRAEGALTAVSPNAPVESVGERAQAASPVAAETNREPRARRLRRHAWSQVARIGVQAAQALSYAHAHRTLHRDIKPGNLLLDADGMVWITDFGLARHVDDGELAVTGAGGTLRYMAPEQLQGYADERSDVYSLGVTLYEVVTLTPPFGCESTRDLLKHISEGDLPPPADLVPEIPRGLEKIIRKATARDAAHRYQSAAALGAALLRFANRQRFGSRWKRLWRRLSKRR